MIIKKSLRFVRDNFYHAGVLFPVANVLNFSQAHDPIGTSIAVGNLAYTMAMSLASAGIQSLPEASGARKFVAKSSSYLENDSDFQRSKLLRYHVQDFIKNPLKASFKFAGRQMTNTLRVTAYCALAVGAVLLSSGAAESLLPGLAAVAFGVGNGLASSPTVERLNANPETKALVRALTHPAVYYGLGYTAAGLMAGGGLELLEQPLHNIPASLSTTLGVSETSLALLGLGMGRFKNPAAGFIAVAVGTMINAVSGMLTGNFNSALANSLAGLGESWLATDAQKKFNLDTKNNPEKYENEKPSILGAVSDVLTSPLRGLMKAGLVRELPPQQLTPAA